MMSAADQPAVPDRHGIPGQTLAAQREAMGWTVEQVADQLKLAVRQVVAIEAGDYAALPSPAVTRGFVRAYAKIMRLDPAPLVAQIDLGNLGLDGSGTSRRERPASFSEVRFRNDSRKSLPLGLIAGAGVLALVAIGAAGWKFGFIPGLNHTVRAAATASASLAVPAGVNAPATSGVATPGVATSGVAAPGVAMPGVATPGVAAANATPELQSTSVPLISVPPPSSSNATVASGVAPALAASGPAATVTTTPAAAAGNELVVAVREESWVEVRKASGGKPLIARLVKGGKTETFDVSEPVTLIVGKPGAVTATLRGSAVELPPTPGKTFSRVALK